ncbi:MAG: hypothetical protein ACIAS6_12940 [Phycisphaerales bacterium JB060]
MSTKYPLGDDAFIFWAREHVTLWEGGQSGPPDIGVTVEQIQELAALVTEGETKLASAKSKRTAYRSAVDQKDTSFGAIKSQLGSMFDSIDSHAKSTGDPDVYARAGLPEPKTPSERPAPPAATAVTTRVRPGGNVLFGFKLRSGGGCVYEVQRRETTLGNVVSPWTFVGLAEDTKRFEDTDVPRGVASVSYRVRARRTNGNAGEWSDASTVYYGTDGQLSTQPAIPQPAEPEEGGSADTGAA